MSRRISIRTLSVCLALVFGIPVIGRAQPRIENPARALAKNAGRVINLEEVQRIRDDGKGQIFKAPRSLTLGPDGSLFFHDYAEGDRIYRYGADGKFVFKILKAGQGPRECQHLSGFFLDRDRIRALAWAPPKIMDFGLDGRYLREARVDEDTHGLWFLGMTEGKIYGIRDEMFNSSAFRSSGTFTAFTVPNAVYEISPDFKTWRKLFEFPVRMMVKRGSGFRLDPIDATIGGSMLYILHTAEYEVIGLDLRAGRVKHIISRKYDRVRSKPQKSSDPDPDPEVRGIVFPDDPYVWDIGRIHAAAGKLWVFTSVMKPNGDDNQVDVFDAEGRYADSIILRYPAGDRNHRGVSRWTLMTDDGLFIIPEQEADGLVSIGKYRIVDAGLFPDKR
jgi:hypothetical protein